MHSRSTEIACESEVTKRAGRTDVEVRIGRQPEDDNMANSDSAKDIFRGVPPSSRVRAHKNTAEQRLDERLATKTIFTNRVRNHLDHQDSRRAESEAIRIGLASVCERYALGYEPAILPKLTIAPCSDARKSEPSTHPVNNPSRVGGGSGP
jgi:hypothetical protein